MEANPFDLGADATAAASSSGPDRAAGQEPDPALHLQIPAEHWPYLKYRTYVRYRTATGGKKWYGGFVVLGRMMLEGGGGPYAVLKLSSTMQVKAVTWTVAYTNLTELLMRLDAFQLTLLQLVRPRRAEGPAAARRAERSVERRAERSVERRVERRAERRPDSRARETRGDSAGRRARSSGK